MKEPKKSSAGLTRRELLRSGSSRGPRAEGDAAETPLATERKRRWGMSIDLDLCTGCGSCVVACKSENNVPVSEHGPEFEGTEVEWMSLLPRFDEEVDGGGRPTELLPMPCFHCENPPCTKVCPVGATYANEEGIVVQVWDRCIGCRYCMAACPYSRRSFNWSHPNWPESARNYLNPDVATRPEGVVEKCTFCHQRLRKLHEGARLEGKAIVDDELQKLTACAQVCPAEAIVFGDLNDEDSLVSRNARSPRADRIQEQLGTQPKVYYLARHVRE